MVEALQVQGFENEPGVSVDFDSFERAIMTCREHTNRQLREREVDILVEMKVSPTLFEECRDDFLQIYEIFRRLSGDAGSIGVLTANDAFLSVYELGLMPRHGWQRECVKYFLVPEDSDDHVYMNTELNFEEFLEFLRPAVFQRWFVLIQATSEVAQTQQRISTNRQMGCLKFKGEAIAFKFIKLNHTQKVLRLYFLSPCRRGSTAEGL